MRGKPGDIVTLGNKRRITPAYAGKTSGRRGISGRSRDHPRVCGENHDTYKLYEETAGSPPRMRGKPISAWNRLAKLRITPAYAGKTYNRQVEKVSTQDHPRVCGENQGPAGQSAHSVGSPPRMRGKQNRAVGLIEPLRITPAYAGKTYRRVTRETLLMDHPRVCGENTSEMAYFRG